MSELIGSLFEDKYYILDVLGKGGMSTVYLAKDIKLEKLWAIKKIDKNLNNMNYNFLMGEANILKKLEHPALPSIVDIFDKEDSLYIVLDYIEGNSLDKKLREIGSIDENLLIDWAKQICEVLKYLHNQKPNPVVYRDMKPGNIMIMPSGRIKLIDFGIAREYKENISSDTTYIGTKGYAAPEQYGNHQTDGRTDIYSLGVTLYHLATGKSPNDPPFTIKPLRELNGHLSEGFEKIVLKCTKEDPNMRYQCVEELIYDIENIDRLNSKYKKVARVKLAKFSLVVIMCIFSMLITVKGANGIKEEKNTQYNQYISQGNEYDNKGEYDQAIDAFNKAIKKDSSRYEGYVQISNTYLKIDESDKAIDFLENQVMSRKLFLSRDKNILYALGKAYFVKKDYKKSYDYFKKVGSDKFEEVKYYKNIAHAFQTTGEVKKNDEILNSVKGLEEYVDKSEDNDLKQDSYITLSDLYRDNPDIFKDSEDKVIQLLKKASTQSTNKSNIVLYERLGQAYFNKGLTVKSDPQLFKDNLKKSLDYYNFVIDSGFKVSYIYENIGMIYKYLSDLSKSEQIFLQMVNLFPNEYRGYVDLALLYNDIETTKPANERNFNKVYEYYKLALDRHSEDSIDMKRLQKLINELKAQGLLK